MYAAEKFILRGVTCSYRPVAVETETLRETGTDAEITGEREKEREERREKEGKKKH